MNKKISKLFPTDFTIYKNKLYGEITLDNLVKITDYITKLEEENENLKADYGSKSQVERDLLEDRINKAIEYLKYGVEPEEMEDYIYENLIEILKGE